MAQNINDSDKDNTRMDLAPHAVTSAKAAKRARNHRDS